MNPDPKVTATEVTATEVTAEPQPDQDRANDQVDEKSDEQTDD